MVPGAAAGGRGRYLQSGDARRRPVHGGGYRGRFCAAARPQDRAGERFWTQCRRLLATPAATRWLPKGGRRGRTRQRAAEGRSRARILGLLRPGCLAAVLGRAIAPRENREMPPRCFASPPNDAILVRAQRPKRAARGGSTMGDKSSEAGHLM